MGCSNAAASTGFKTELHPGAAPPPAAARINKRLFRLLAMASIAATAPGAVRPGSSSSASSEDVTHFMSEREVGGRSTVLSSACAESRACYSGVHGNLEKTL